MCCQGLNTKHSLSQMETSLSPFSFTIPQLPKQLSERSSVTKYLLIHSQLGCTYDFLPDLDVNTAPPLPVFQYQIMPTTCFPLLALRLQTIARESHWTTVYLVWSWLIDWRLIRIAILLIWLRAMELKKGKIIWSALWSSSFTGSYHHNLVLVRRTLIELVLLWLDFKFWKLN